MIKFFFSVIKIACEVLMAAGLFGFTGMMISIPVYSYISLPTFFSATIFRTALL